MRKTTFVLLVALIFAAVAMVIAGKQHLNQAALRGITADCVQVIGMEVNALNREKLPAPDSEAYAHIAQLIRGSVINAGLDADGRALDPYGTRFRIDTVAVGQKLTTTVVSAGPDGQFATPDDIRYTQESTIEPRVLPTTK